MSSTGRSLTNHSAWLLAALALSTGACGPLPGDEETPEAADGAQVSSELRIRVNPCDVDPNKLTAPTMLAFVRDQIAHDNDSYVEMPPNDQAAVAAAAVSLAHKNDFAQAQADVAGTDYEVRRLKVGNECLSVLRPTPGRQYEDIQATLVVRHIGWTHDMMLEVPHARPENASGTSGDRYTKEQGGLLFNALAESFRDSNGVIHNAYLRPRALMIAGSHRCALWDPVQGFSPDNVDNTVPGATCPGGYSASPPAACPPQNPYFLVSDVAHAENNAFLTIHDALLHQYGSRMSTLQLHTNGSAGTNGLALVSNGTRTLAQAGTNVRRFHAALATWRSNLQYQVNQEPILTCNDGMGNKSSMMCGTQNVQSINAADPALTCHNPLPTSTTDRFIHLEQNTMDSLADCKAWTAVVARAIHESVWTYLIKL